MSRAARCTRTAGATCSRRTCRTSSPTSAGRARGPSSTSTSPPRIPASTDPAPRPSSCSPPRRAAQFTAPNWIANSYAAASLSANVDLGDTLSLQALGYYRYFRQSVTTAMRPTTRRATRRLAGLLCTRTGRSTTIGGGLIMRLPGRRAIRPARHAEHQHECLRRRPAAHRHRQACSGRENNFVAGEPRRRTDAVRRDVVCRRPDLGRHADLHRPRRGRSTSPAPIRPSTSASTAPTWGLYLADTSAAHAAAGADGVGPLEHRDHHPQRSQRRRPQRLAQLSALQSRRRR